MIPFQAHHPAKASGPQEPACLNSEEHGRAMRVRIPRKERTVEVERPGLRKT